MIPRFRVCSKQEKRLILSEDILAIDYENEEIVTQKIYFEDGLPNERDVECCDFDDIVLMQSTGLNDKNGKEIFEGDILSIETDEENVKVEVSWDSKHALFAFESKKYNEKEPLAELFEDNSYPFKIIGNIWENPELLEVRT